MQTEQQIREAQEHCKAEIATSNMMLSNALLNNDTDKIGEYASQLGMLGNIYLGISEILK